MEASGKMILNHGELKAGPPGIQPGIGVDDAIIYLLDRSLSHLEFSGSTVRIVFVDCSCAFNTIQPSLLRVILEEAADQWTATWLRGPSTDHSM